MTIDMWGKPPKKGSGRKPKYSKQLEVVKNRWLAGDRETWGVLNKFKKRTSAASAATYLRKTYPDFEYRTSRNPDNPDEFVVWGHYKGGK